MRTAKSVLVFAVWVAIVFALPAESAPGKPGTYGLSPVEYSEEMLPGQSKLLTFTVTNNDSEPQRFEVEITGCTLDRYGQAVFPSAQRTDKYSAANWLRMNSPKPSPELVVPANASTDFSVELSVPFATPPGEYFAAVFVKQSSYTPIQKGSLELNVRSRIGAIVTVIIPGSFGPSLNECRVSETLVSLPANDSVDDLQKLVAQLKSETILSKGSLLELSRTLSSLGMHFDYTAYESWDQPTQRAFRKHALDLVNYAIVEARSVRITSTLASQCQTRVVARGEAFIYQLVEREGGRTLKVLRDRFILRPSGSRTKGDSVIFPGSMRDFHGEIQRPLPSGDYLLEVRFMYRAVGDQGLRRIHGQTEFTVDEDVAVDMREALLVGVDLDLLEYEMVPGEFSVKGITVENLDLINPINVSLRPTADWLEVSPRMITIGPGRKRTVRIAIGLSRDDEQIDREGSVLLIPETGKTVSVDVIVRDKRRHD